VNFCKENRIEFDTGWWSYTYMMIKASPQKLKSSESQTPSIEGKPLK